MDNTITALPSPPPTNVEVTAYNPRPVKSDVPSHLSPDQYDGDKVILSTEALDRKTRREVEETGKRVQTNINVAAADNSEEKSVEELLEIQKLQRRDKEVRAHEQAHLLTAGQYVAGSVTYSYETGPDGKRYATGGEVPIDLSKEALPEDTLAKMVQVKRAALAPATPSAADRNIAARSSIIAAEARNAMNSAASRKDGNNDAVQNNSEDKLDRPEKTPETSQDNSSTSPAQKTIPSYGRHLLLQAYANQTVES